jgi:hypothetical protein
MIAATRTLIVAFTANLGIAAAHAQAPSADYAGDARALDRIIVENYAYEDLKGAVYDFPLPSSGLVVKLPAERLYTVEGLPREKFIPKPVRDQ